MMTNMYAAFVVLLFLFVQLCASSGQFEIELERLINRKGLNNNGTCCHGPNGFLTCLQPCRTFIRFCLRNSNPNLDQLNRPVSMNTQECTYGFDETPILGGNTIDFTRAVDSANRIVLPFKFSWMGDFVLHIDIFNDHTYDSQPYPGSRRDLILSTTIRSSIWPNSTWQQSQTIDSSLNAHEFSFRYRVSCSTHFYGSQCSRFCSPLSPHSRCDPDTGDVLCQQGWTGVDCNQAICRQGCQHGQCLNQPDQCLCQVGWTGKHCDQSLEKKSVSSPTKERCPICLNGGKCLKSTCQCPSGYRGVSCEERICHNGGLSSMGKCRCPPSYQGEQCEIESNCPICRNQGRCENNKCICTKDFIGQYCEINIQLIQKKEKRLFSMELIVVILFVLLFLVALIVFSCLFYKYASQRQKQLQQMKEINLEKIWTIDGASSNIFHEKNLSKEKLPENKDINAKLKQMDVHASLV